MKNKKLIETTQERIIEFLEDILYDVPKKVMLSKIKGEDTTVEQGLDILTEEFIVKMGRLLNEDNQDTTINN